METPFTLPCGAQLSNRLCKPAMSETLAWRSGRPSPELVNIYRRWGREGKAGLLVTGNIMVDGGRLGEPRNAILEDETHLDAFREMAEAAKCAGSKAIVQINHPGKQCTLPLLDPVAPSSVSLNVPLASLRKVRALTIPEIENIIHRFARTAELAMKAGFDGVQIHGAHGYLVSQFLSPLANIRTDEYGGDSNGRMNFLLSIVRETRKRIGPNAILSVKLNSADFQKGGFSEEDSLGVILALEKEGIDLLEISGGNYESPAMTGVVGASTRKREAYFLEFAQKVRAVSKVPLMLSGGVRTLDFANEVISKNEVDIIGIARPFAVFVDAGARFLSGEDLSKHPTPKQLGIKLADGFIFIMWHAQLLGENASGVEPSRDWLNPFLILVYMLPKVMFRSATQFPQNDWKHALMLVVIVSLLLRKLQVF